LIAARGTLKDYTGRTLPQYAGICRALLYEWEVDSRVAKVPLKGQMVIPGRFDLYLSPNINDPDAYTAGGSCGVTYNSKNISRNPFEVLHGQNIKWKPVNGLPGGVVGGSEHDGAQVDGICRVAVADSPFRDDERFNNMYKYGVWDYVIGKDIGGKCYLPEDKTVEMHKISYEVVKYK
jgi:hypothetical protein